MGAGDFLRSVGLLAAFLGAGDFFFADLAGVFLRAGDLERERAGEDVSQDARQGDKHKIGSPDAKEWWRAWRRCGSAETCFARRDGVFGFFAS